MTYHIERYTHNDEYIDDEQQKTTVKKCEVTKQQVQASARGRCLNCLQYLRFFLLKCVQWHYYSTIQFHNSYY